MGVGGDGKKLTTVYISDEKRNGEKQKHKPHGCGVMHQEDYRGSGLDQTSHL